MMISKSLCSCSAKNNEESHRERGIGSGEDMSGHSGDFDEVRPAQREPESSLSVQKESRPPKAPDEA